MTRRAMLAGIPAALAAANVPVKRAKPLPRVGEFTRLIDPATDAIVVRLTSVSSANLLPEPSNRFISVKDRFLVFSSDRMGRLQPYRLDLRTGVLMQLAETEALDPRSLCLDDSERFLYLIDKGLLKEVSTSGRGLRTVTEDVSAFGVGRSPSDLIVVKRGQLQALTGGAIAQDVTDGCLVRPDGNGCLFGRGTSEDDTEFWYAPLGQNAKPRLLAKGKISFPYWSPDGQWLLFLRAVPKNDVVLSEIHQVYVETCEEQAVSPTSQFAAFSPNRDASVFVGASRSKAQPNVVLLLRSAKREMTLCEHHAKQAAAVGPVFSPDSRRVYYQSDREGKPAIYSINVELLVEPT